MKRLPFTFIAAFLFLQNVPVKAGDIEREALFGSWEQRWVFKDGGRITEIFRFEPKGTFLVDVVANTKKYNGSYNYGGVWKLEGTNVVLEVENSSFPEVPAGKIGVNQILKLTENIVVTKGDDGRVTVARKYKENK